MVIVGLDQAPKGIGFAYGEPGSVPSRGYHENPDYGDNTSRLTLHVYEWALQFIKSTGAERVYFEQVIVRTHGLHLPTLYKQFGCVAGIELAAAQMGIADDAWQVNIAEWRTFFYSGARPPKGANSETAVWKDMALRQCLEEGWMIADLNHNVAEACGIWMFGCACSDKKFKVARSVKNRRIELRRERAEA